MPRSEAKSATIRKEGYSIYLELGGILHYPEYRKICEMFNMMVMDEIIKGKTFHPGNNFGKICIMKVERNFAKPRVDWKESHLLRKELLAEGKKPREAGSEEGENWLVYRVDDYYLRFYWDKRRTKIANKTAYSFHATRGKKGAKTKLAKRCEDNDLAHLAFKTIKRDKDK